MIMYLTLLLCSYFYQGDFLYSTKFQVAYFELSYSWVRKIPGRRERLPTPVFLGFPGGSAVKNPPAMQEIWVKSLGWEDPLEKEMATHSSILAWRI